MPAGARLPAHVGLAHVGPTPLELAHVGAAPSELAHAELADAELADARQELAREEQARWPVAHLRAPLKLVVPVKEPAWRERGQEPVLAGRPVPEL